LLIWGGGPRKALEVGEWAGKTGKRRHPVKGVWSRLHCGHLGLDPAPASKHMTLRALPTRDSQIEPSQNGLRVTISRVLLQL
jgi:hypothetical protein